MITHIFTGVIAINSEAPTHIIFDTHSDSQADRSQTSFLRQLDSHKPSNELFKQCLHTGLLSQVYLLISYINRLKD